jgi:hypothetical protein
MFLQASRSKLCISAPAHHSRCTYQRARCKVQATTAHGALLTTPDAGSAFWRAEKMFVAPGELSVSQPGLTLSYLGPV